MRVWKLDHFHGRSSSRTLRILDDVEDEVIRYSCFTKTDDGDFGDKDRDISGVHWEVAVDERKKER